jgi:hypothetical protein
MRGKRAGITPYEQSADNPGTENPTTDDLTMMRPQNDAQ